jgi:hypothetical protein
MTDETLLRLLPPVVRARDFRLYTQNGRRLVDLWQHNGAAVLGNTPTGMLRAFKNTAERGLYSPLPHHQERRFHKALSALLPGMGFRLYRGDAALLRALGIDAFPDPALGSALPPATQPATPLLWRPFLGIVFPSNCPLIPVLPEPWPDALCVLALPPVLAESVPAETAPVETAPEPPPPQLIPPTILAAASRGVYDLIAAKTVRGRLDYPRVEQALIGNKWRRRGIYLSLSSLVDNETYAALFQRFLDHGFLLPPVQTHPLILPGILSPGEEAKLAELLNN